MIIISRVILFTTVVLYFVACSETPLEILNNGENSAVSSEYLSPLSSTPQAQSNSVSSQEEWHESSSSIIQGVSSGAVEPLLSSSFVAAISSNDISSYAQGSQKMEISSSEGGLSGFEVLLNEEQYNDFFPRRFGLGSLNPLSDGDYDFYSYKSFVAAVNNISAIEVTVLQREGVTYAQKILWQNNVTSETRVIITHEDYDASWNINKPEIEIAKVDYSLFLGEGDLQTRKKEMAAFLANISHETTGSGQTDPAKNTGLYWREEVSWQQGSTELGYLQGSALYEPAPGKSYHGRGPIQLSYPFNYGQVSEFIFGDKTVLLNNPEMLLEGDATLAFMTAIWFWMTPQSPKPSAHAVMVQSWEPSQEDIAMNRNSSDFGMTINIINGGLECGDGREDDYRVMDRIGFYERYALILDVTLLGVNTCHQMQYY